MTTAERAQALAADPEVKPELGHGGARPGAGRPPRTGAGLTEGDDGTGGEGCENQDAIGTLISRGSNKAEQLVRRLKRDAPDVAADPQANLPAETVGVVGADAGQPSRSQFSFVVISRVCRISGVTT